MPEQLADVVPLCRALRRDDLPGVHCPHCASPVDDDLVAVVLPLPVPALLTDREVLAGEL